MAVYEITLEDGSAYEIETAEQKPFVPRHAEVEQRIAERDNPIKALLEEARKPVNPKQYGMLSTMLQPLAFGMKGLGAAMQLVEAPLASAGLAAQRGELFTPQAGEEIVKSFTGERPAEFGDIMRSVNVPEPIASTTGMLGLMGLLNPKATASSTKKIITQPGKVAREAGQELSSLSRLTQQGIDKIKSKIPKPMGKDFVINRNKAAAQLLDETRSELGKAVGEAIEKAGDIKVDSAKIQAATKAIKLPDNVVSALNDPMYGIERLADGSFSPTIKNIQKITVALDDFMTSKTWEEATRMGQKQIKQVYGILKQSMKEAAPSIKEPISKYHDFMDSYHLVNKTLRDSVGNVMEKGSVRALRGGGERALQQAWENFAKFEPKAQQIMNDIIKFTQRQALKRFGKYGLVGYGGLELGKKVIRGVTGER